LVENSSFGADEIKTIATAFEGALIDLRLTHRDDRLTEVVAKKIFAEAIRGERDPMRLRERAVMESKSKDQGGSDVRN
jgi:hypothetical protein